MVIVEGPKVGAPQAYKNNGVTANQSVIYHCGHMKGSQKGTVDPGLVIDVGPKVGKKSCQAGGPNGCHFRTSVWVGWNCFGWGKCRVARWGSKNPCS